MSIRDEKDELYTENVMDHYESPFHEGHCQHPTHSHEDNNPLCGDKVRIELQINPDGQVQQAWFNGDGCIMSQASASMLMEHIEGKTIDEVKRIGAKDMLALVGARVTPRRQACCLLPWRVVQAALHAPVEPERPEGTATNSPG
jgi:nitrogen fixation protein NifU and related proteins